MKKIKRFLAAALALSLCTAGICPVNASVAIDEAAKIIEENRVYIPPSDEIIDDAGYFEDYFNNLETFPNPHPYIYYSDRNYKGRYIAYLQTHLNCNNNYSFCFYFPDAKNTLVIRPDESFTESDFEKLTEIFGEHVQYDDDNKNILLLDGNTLEETEKAEKLCEQLKSDGKISYYEYRDYSGEHMKIYYGSSLKLDNLYYMDTTKQKFDAQAVYDFLKSENIACSIKMAKTGSYIMDTDKTPLLCYAVEFRNDLSLTEKFATAKLIYDKFGYRMIENSYNEFPKLEGSFTYTEIDENYVSLPAVKTDPVISDDEFMYGDLNFDSQADMTDMSMLSLHLLKDITLNQKAIQAADVMYDSEINVADLSYFKQYISGKDVILGKYDEYINDLTASCSEYRFGPGSDKITVRYPENTALISSMEEYNAFADFYSLTSANNLTKNVNISEEFFKENRLAFFIDNNSDLVNRVKYTLTSVKTDKTGNVKLSFDRLSPEITTELAGRRLIAVVIPGNPEQNCSITAEINNIPQYRYMTSKSIIRNSTVSYYEHPEMSGAITSMEQYNEYNEKLGGTLDEATSHLHISEEYFKENTLLLYSVNTNRKNYINCIAADYLNQLYMRIYRYDSADSDEIKNWVMTASVPNSELGTAFTSSLKIDINQSRYMGDNYQIPAIMENGIIKNAKTDFEAADEEDCVTFISSYDEFVKLNESLSGELQHVEDSFITEDFFNNNVLALITRNIPSDSICGITNIKAKENGEIEFMINEYRYAGKEPDTTLTKWHLSASIPKKCLIYDIDDTSAVLQYTYNEYLNSDYDIFKTDY